MFTIKLFERPKDRINFSSFYLALVPRSFCCEVTAGGMSRTFASSAQDPVPLERPALYVVSVYPGFDN